MSDREGVLVTAAARLGRRPAHGELWLLDDGLLYRALDWRRTVAQLRAEPGRRAPAQTVDPADRPRQRFAGADVDRIATEAPANRWVARPEVAAARLRRRPATARLHLELVDGQRVALTWPRREQATPAVEERLTEWLGDRLDVR